MITREQIVAEARTWLDTPFHHQGRLKGIGVDCAGVPIGVARALGLEWADQSGYARVPAKGQFRATLQRCLDPIAFADVLPGDLMSFAFLTEEQHVAIVASANPIRLIHAWEAIGKCVENGFDATWQRRLRGCWRFRAPTFANGAETTPGSLPPEGAAPSPRASAAAAGLGLDEVGSS